MAFLDRFRRPQKSAVDDYPARDPDTVLAYYLDPGGRLDAIKTGLAYPGAGNYLYGITSPYADVPIQSNPTGFAYASIVSTWAARCIHIRKTIINRIPWSVVDRRTGKPIPGHPFEIAVRRANVRGQKIFMLHEWAQCIWGETFLWPVKNEFGYYSDLVWLNNLGMEVITLAGMIGGYSYAPITGGRVKQFKTDELVFYYTDNPFNNLRGVSPFDTILLEVGVDKDIARHLKAWYSNNARPGLMLIPENDTSVFASQEFMDFWKANFQGAANAGKPVLMPSLIKDIKEIQQAPKVDDIEQRLAVRTEICAQFGVPLAIAGAWDDANYDSVDTQRKSLYEETIIPETETIDDDFTERLLPCFDEWGTAKVQHDFTNIKALMEDEGAKAQAVNQRLVSGGISLNEYRDQFDLPKLPNGNVFYVPTGVIVTPVNEIGKQPATPPTPLLQAPAQPQPPPSVEPPQASQLPAGESPEKPALPPPAQRSKMHGKSISSDYPSSYCALGRFDSVAEIIQIQDTLRGSLQNRVDFDQIEWVDPAELHVTLAYVQSGLLAGLEGSLPLNPGAISIIVDGLGVFDTPDGFAIHLTIRKAGDLLPAQAALAMSLETAGCVLSDFSKPDAYTPHITLAYSRFDVIPFSITPFSILMNKIELCDSSHQPIVEQALKSTEKKAQASPADELAAWEKKALNGGAAKALKFECHLLPKPLAQSIREALMDKPEMNKADIRVLFAKSQNILLEGEPTTTTTSITTLTPDGFGALVEVWRQLGIHELVNEVENAAVA